MLHIINHYLVSDNRKCGLHQR